MPLPDDRVYTFTEKDRNVRELSASFRAHIKRIIRVHLGRGELRVPWLAGIGDNGRLGKGRLGMANKSTQ